MIRVNIHQPHLKRNREDVDSSLPLVMVYDEADRENPSYGDRVVVDGALRCSIEDERTRAELWVPDHGRVQVYEGGKLNDEMGDGALARTIDDWRGFTPKQRANVLGMLKSIESPMWATAWDLLRRLGEMS